MRTKIVWPVLVGLGLVLGACGTVDGGNDDGAGEPSQGESGEGSTTNEPIDPSIGGSGPAATGGSESGGQEEEDTGTDTGCTFLCPPEDTGGGFPCDIFVQDCMENEKCMPWANDGGNVWNGTRCSPIADNPGQAGDECTVEGSGTSGIDSCDIGTMCWNVDPETNTGTCVAMCTGDAANPLCEDPGTTCVNVNDGAIVLCLPQCDPLLQDCAAGEACYGINDVFTCVPDASGESGIYGDPCEFINVCDPGLFCANAETVPGCTGSVGCCSEFCDLEDPAGNDQCSGVAGGQECVPWTQDPDPGLEAVGACVIPA
ncbi:ribulose phosphate epimerase [Paraliomyxa miuraensis]|uniref:ribulose phosphate epimerase n=1 Tax=Paraliomyxa miuraensis TaxID=376150 RepID=UPI002257D58D|nr:ribulose phosphate epimerase [Paraliomyxa miuraensis]MCX4242612.1 ribulose phosphate epimerase [Paraliomyxa miuraensis]